MDRMGVDSNTCSSFFFQITACAVNATSEVLTLSLGLMGSIVSPGNIQMAVSDWPVSVIHLRWMERFLGFANFYRRFIENYSSAPFPALISPISNFLWNAQEFFVPQVTFTWSLPPYLPLKFPPVQPVYIPPCLLPNCLCTSTCVQCSLLSGLVSYFS